MKLALSLSCGAASSAGLPEGSGDSSGVMPRTQGGPGGLGGRAGRPTPHSPPNQVS